jgi:hypothetical protein
MTNVIAISPTAEHRALVIEEVRSVMGRRRLNASELGRRTGRPQQYWSRRLTGLTALDVDDLATLSLILEVPMSTFVPSYQPPTSPHPAGGGVNFLGVTPLHRGWNTVGPEGLEPPASSVKSGKLLHFPTRKHA